MPSSNNIFLNETTASTESPVNSLQIFKIFSLKVRGTNAGKVSMISMPNFFATSYPNELAPIFGTDKPPVATTSELLL